MAKTLEEKKIVPQLRFPGFRKNWTAKRFDDLYYFLTTNSFSRNFLTSEKQTIQNIHYGDIHTKFNSSFDLSIEDAPYIKKTIETSKIKEENYCKKGDIIFADASEDYSDIGKAIEIINIDGQKLVAGLHTIHARPLDNSAKGFMANLLKTFSFRYQMMKNAQGTKVLGISSSRITNFTIYKPLEEKEQEKIASFLTAVDEKINLLRQKQDCLQTYKRGVMQKIFAQEIRFTHDDGTSFPDWEEKPFKEIFEELTNRVGDRDIETYSITAGKGFVSQREKFGKDISGEQNPNYTCLAPGEFAYNKGNSKTFKYGCVYQNTNDFHIAVPNVFISFKKIRGKTSSTFYEKLFEFHYLDRHLRRLISSGARMDGLLNINKSLFFEIKLPNPIPEEQIKIADFLSAIDQKIDALNNKITQMETFKKGLLQKMFV